jgi:hypothetical protein
MKDTTDQTTLDFFGEARPRGRPVTGKAKTGAQRQAAYRAKQQRNNVTVTINRGLLEQLDAQIQVIRDGGSAQVLTPPTAEKVLTALRSAQLKQLSPATASSNVQSITDHLAQRGKAPRKVPLPIWRLKIELLGVAPVIWRRVDTYATVTLSKLHCIIQAAMGWEMSHLFSFDDELGRALELGNDLSDVAAVGDWLLYTYDFGDNWQHRVTIEKVITKPTGTYPRVVDGKQACPPEDCGGPWGYMDMCEVLVGPNNARRRELLEWLGGEFNPKWFDLDEALSRLKAYS